MAVPIDKPYIDSLVAAKLPESKTVEYKESLPTNSDGDKAKFLASVCSFANEQGGDLIYGIVEERDKQNTPTGEPSKAEGLAGVNVDSEKLRLEQLLANCVQRRIGGIRIEEVKGFPKGPVVVVRIPQSWDRPHMVTFGGRQRFYRRTNSGSQPMDFEEIRRAYLGTASIPQGLKSFRYERLEMIRSGDTPHPVLTAIPAVVFHLIPLTSLSDGPQVSAEQLYEQELNFHTLLGMVGCSTRFNVDGILAHDERMPGGYTQVFRDGRIEAVDQTMLQVWRGKPEVSSGGFQDRLLEVCPSYVRGLEAVDIPPPFVVLVSIVGGKGYTLAVHPNVSTFYSRGKGAGQLDRDDILLPSIEVQSSSDDATKYLRPIFDALWNACGYPRCLHYDDQGVFHPG